MARFGLGRVVSIDRSRPEHLLVRSAAFAPRALLAPPPRDPLAETVLEGTGAPLAFGRGTVEVLERTNRRHRLRVRVEAPGGLLVVARTWDRSWRARVDGIEVASLRADGFLTAVRVPAGRHEVAWNGRDTEGRDAPAGLYFCRMNAGAFTRTLRLALLR